MEFRTTVPDGLFGIPFYQLQLFITETKTVTKRLGELMKCKLADLQQSLEGYCNYN